MPVPSLLAVYAHPDDESLWSGGVLAQHAAAGARTAVVTTTWGADSPRAAELAGALEILGAGKPRMLGYADARAPESAPGRVRLCDAPLDQTVRDLVTHLREFRPEIVITHDAYGGLTGHPDHLHTHRITALAFHAAGLELLYPDTGTPWQPSALYLATHPHTVAKRLSLDPPRWFESGLLIGFGSGGWVRAGCVRWSAQHFHGLSSPGFRGE